MIQLQTKHNQVNLSSGDNSRCLMILFTVLYRPHRLFHILTLVRESPFGFHRSHKRSRIRYPHRSTISFECQKHQKHRLERSVSSSQDRLDGQVLVPYQCVVRRDAWESIRERFNVAYPLQKTAYRHANGGSGAPGMYLGQMG